MFRISRRRLYSQYFLHNRTLVSNLVRNSSISKKDLVLEIGPGKGIITEQLLSNAGYVFAVEIDKFWYEFLQNKFKYIPNLHLYNTDFLKFPLPGDDYKVFANIPFAIEGKIIRELLTAENPPADCYLIIRKQLANRLAGSKKENMFTLMYRPWFKFSIVHHFHSRNFKPVSNTKSVMFRFTKRLIPLLPWKQKLKYQEFIKTGFTNGRPVLKNLKTIYGISVTIKAMSKFRIFKKSRPGHLTLMQWLNIYQELVNKNFTY